MYGIGIGESDFKILRIKRRLLYRQNKIYKRHDRQQKQSTINNTTKKIRKNIKYEYVKILF